MGSNPIPIYAKSNQGKSGYTIYLDMVSKQAYRAHHKEFSQSKYLIGFFTLLFIMRGLAELSLPDTLLVKSLILLIGVPTSIFLGKVLHRRSMDELLEIYVSEYMLEDYIEQGKKLMIREIIATVIFLFIAITLGILFIMYNWLVWIAFSFITFIIVGVLINSLSIKRWKFYQNGL